MDNYTNVPLSFDVSLYGTLEEFDDSKSKCRVRIFYKGLNRNRTYISEEFANQLIASLPYAPIKGIFNNEEVDFEGHGEKNSEGKIYGLVMAEPNFAWEEHLDSDGITRTYACADVILYTALYNEAKMIPGSSQSMEINPYNFSGEWKIWEDGQPYYHFYKGSLFGLQALGATTEPCFEGAAFYSLMFEKLKNDYDALMSYTTKIDKKEEKVRMEMDKSLFRLSDNEKADKIWEAMNPNFNEQGGFTVDCYVLDVYDDYALTAGKDGYKRAYYTKNEDDTVTIDKVEVCYITDVTEAEMNALNAMKAASGSFEVYKENFDNNTAEIEVLKNSVTEKDSKIAEYEAQVAEMTTKISEFETIVSEKDTAIEEANTKYSALEAEKVVLERSNADLINEKEELVSFKHNVENNEKEQFLLKYAEHLTDSIIEEFKTKFDDYSVEDFKKEVTYAAAEQDPTLFNKNDEPNRYYKGGSDSSKSYSGWERILNNYKNGGNK